jgi:hypothetical protein
MSKRWITRTIHVVLGIPVVGYVYSPFDKLPDYAFRTRFIFIPALILTGVWMWKGHVVLRWFSRVPAQHAADPQAGQR